MKARSADTSVERSLAEVCAGRSIALIKKQEVQMMDTRGRLNVLKNLEEWPPAPGFESLEAMSCLL